ncbi:MAG: hypothetical protein ACI9C9_000777 [Marivirga sp.]|jgi:hypothetical protein
MRRSIILLLFSPILSFSQGLEGGAVDNDKDDLIARLVINEADPALDEPVSDIIKFEKSIIAYSAGILYAYDFDSEKTTPLIDLGFGSAKFVQLVGSSLYINLYDVSGSFKTCYQYDLAAADPKTGVIQEFAEELVEVFSYDTFRYMVLIDNTTSDFYKLGYSNKLGSDLVIYDTRLLPQDYQLRIDTKGFAFTVVAPVGKLTERRMSYIESGDPVNIKSLGVISDASFSFVNDQAFYSVGKEIFKIGLETGYATVLLEEAISDGITEATNFFTLGTTIFGYYVKNGDGSRNVVLVETGGVAAIGGYKYINLFETAAYLNFAKTIVSIVQAGESHIAVSNFSGSSFQTLVIDLKGNIVNDIPQDPIKIITSFPIYKAILFDDKYLSIHFQRVLDGKVYGSLGYINLDNPANFAFSQLPTSDDVGYDFEPSFATSRAKNYVVFNTVDNGFELHILTDKTQSGYQLTEEITNDEFSQKVLEQQGVKDVLQPFSTYPERLITYNNTLYYLAHLAAEKFNGYSYLYKVNMLPTNMALANNSVSESIASTTTVANIGVADLDDDSFSFALIGGAGSDNNDLFNIVGSSLRTNGGFNYEVDSTLSIKIRVTDPHGATFQKVFSLEVTNANDTPTGISLSGDKIGENAPSGTKIADISTEDEDANDSFTYTLVDDAGGAFTINGSELLTNQTYNEATLNQYSIKIRAEDQLAAFLEQDFVIGITESNIIPSDIFLSGQEVPENAGADQLIGELTTEDADPEDSDFTYALVEGTGSDNNNSFVIDNATTPPTLKASSVFDFETANAQKIRISTTDPKGANYAKQFQIAVTDTNDGPTEVLLSADSIAENQLIDTKVGALSTVDVDSEDSFSYSLTIGEGDTNNNDFTIDETSGDLLQAVGGFNYEAKNEYSIRVTSTDSEGEVAEGILQIRIVDLNEEPSALILSDSTVNEEDASAIVGVLEVIDPDAGDTYTLSLPDTLDNSYFELAAGGLLGLSGALNYENIAIPNPLSVALVATDAGGFSLTRGFEIVLEDVNDAPDSLYLALPTGQFSPKDAQERICRILIGDQELGEILSLNYDNNFYSILLVNPTANDGLRFEIEYDVSSEVYYLKAAFEAGITYDSEVQANNIFNISLKVEDTNHPSGELKTFSKEFTITVVDENAPLPPESLSLSNNIVNENPAENENGFVVGALNTEDENSEDSHGYSLVANQEGDDFDNSSFKIIPGTMDEPFMLSFNDDVMLVYATDSVYMANVRTTDNTQLSTERVFTIYVQEYVDVIAPVFDAGTQQSNLVSDGSAVSLKIGISDWKLVNVQFQKASILSSIFAAPQEATYDLSTQTLAINISENDFDAFGLKLKVIAADEAGNQSTSETFYVYRSLTSSSTYSDLPSEYLGQGRLTSDFKMFSIPYNTDNLGVKVFLERQLGVALGSETFQIFQYNPVTGEYINGVSLDNFELGKAYWFTTLVEDPQINFGVGELYPYKAEFGEDSVFVFNLKQGWNQIGNPYPIALDWAGLIEGTNIGQLQIFNEGTYSTTGTLPVHGGGFVLVQEEVDLPAVIRENVVQRVADPSDFLWKADFKISQNGLTNEGSIGMHEQASMALDHFDVANPPHFREYLEIDFNKTPRFYTNYRQDVVSPQSYYSWFFHINSHKKDSPLLLNWSSKGLLPKQLFLLDLETLNKVDMSKVQNLTSNSGGVEGFRVIYSSDGELFNLGDLLVGTPVPNPTKLGSSISLNLPESNDSYEVTAEIVNLQGRSVKDIYRNSLLSGGFHTLSWDGNNKYGDPAASGVYLYRISIQGSQSGVFTGRILKQN